MIEVLKPVGESFALVVPPLEISDQPGCMTDRRSPLQNLGGNIAIRGHREM